ncbi:YggS family pyridoxal phosphate-dependent enzyme [Ignatzschineria rhizosphaerae]|uniref:Pyridoxal phosphate homeostasis protein n=1 Tax=Ignatzschineria rhizosphaerae TaxID=2923279 RepID=A0ABY3X739_9GAMM|nr:YggS family pyridoxal phosphate-dependent enzyme [Ignatzschineria rhizosphaerae]UNM96862.1 YggS family pyridoxal phosphate-dependent enzyme [Ignatzschineria rhizosphaerae]
MTDNELLNNIQQINHRIEKAALSAGRDPQEISLLLATKTRSPELINRAIALGYGLIGENRAQELVEKAPFLSKAQTAITPRETHFIGALQGNKVNEVTAIADCIQSVDRIRIARRINQYALDHDLKRSIMIQVNSSRDPNKQGLMPEELPDFLKEMTNFSQLSIRGLMTIGLQSDDEMIIRRGFAELKTLRDKMISEGLLAKTAIDLSMGMSQDLELAILEGATIIRVGSDIFGARS